MTQISWNLVYPQLAALLSWSCAQPAVVILSCSAWNKKAYWDGCFGQIGLTRLVFKNPDSKVHGANMGPTWGRHDPGGPHVVHVKLAIWEEIRWFNYTRMWLEYIGFVNCSVVFDVITNMSRFCRSFRRFNGRFAWICTPLACEPPAFILLDFDNGVVRQTKDVFMTWPVEFTARLHMHRTRVDHASESYWNIIRICLPTSFNLQAHEISFATTYFTFVKSCCVHRSHQWNVVLFIWWHHQMKNFPFLGPLCGDFTGHRWIPLTKASDAERWCFLWFEPGQTVERAI